MTSGNVLLDEQLRAKVSDFGLSRPYDYRMTLRPGNRFYMAPELLLGTSTYTTAVDIYSLAVIMWEIYANERPYSDISASKMKNEVGINQASAVSMYGRVLGFVRRCLLSLFSMPFLFVK